MAENCTKDKSTVKGLCCMSVQAKVVQDTVEWCDRWVDGTQSGRDQEWHKTMLHMEETQPYGWQDPSFCKIVQIDWFLAHLRRKKRIQERFSGSVRTPGPATLWRLLLYNYGLATNSMLQPGLICLVGMKCMYTIKLKLDYAYLEENEIVRLFAQISSIP